MWPVQPPAGRAATWKQDSAGKEGGVCLLSVGKPGRICAGKPRDPECDQQRAAEARGQGELPWEGRWTGGENGKGSKQQAGG